MNLSIIFPAVGLLLILSSASLAASPSATVPLDNRLYVDLDRLSALGLLDSYLQGTRPVSRTEAARLIRESADRFRLESGPVAAGETLQRLQDEFREDLGELSTGGKALDGSYLKPLRSLSLGYAYREGAASVIASSVNRGRIDSAQFALAANRYGEEFPEHHSGRLQGLSEARWGWLQLEWQPLVEFRKTAADGTAAEFRTLRGKAALQLGAIEVSAGRQSLWWGQGRHGSLLLTDNAPPLDMIRLTNPTPVQLPWLLSGLGPFRFDLFWSRLEPQRVVPEPYLAGLRFNLKPWPWLELGAARTVMFGGKGRPPVDTEEFFTILGGKNPARGKDNSNSVAALDGRLRLPFLGGLALYGEYGGEDEAGHFLANMAWLAGMYLPRLDPAGRLSLRLEYADLGHIDDNSPVWYRHGIYRSGYAYEGKILGHHVGGAGRGYSAELTWFLPGGVTTALALDLERRGLDQAVVETHQQAALSLLFPLNRESTLQVDWAVDQVRNAGFIQQDSRFMSLGTITISRYW